MTEHAGDETIIIREDSDFYEELSEYLDVLGSSTRLRILKSIEKKPKDVREISAEIETSYENTKKHLDKLLKTGVIKKEAGLSKPTSKGVHPVWKYSLIPGGLEAIIRNLGVFSNIHLTLTDQELKSRLDEVREIVSEELMDTTPVLMLIGGPDDGKVFPLTRDMVSIGRVDTSATSLYDSETDVVLSEIYVAVTRISKPHARIIRTNTTWFIEDCGSTGGTYVNSESLVKGERVKLQNGDLIDLAKGIKGARFVFTLPQSRES